MYDVYDLSLSPTGRLSDLPDIAKYGPPFRSLQDAKKWQNILLRPRVIQSQSLTDHRKLAEHNRIVERDRREAHRIAILEAAAMLEHAPVKRQDSIAGIILAYGLLLTAILLLAFAFVLYLH